MQLRIAECNGPMRLVWLWMRLSTLVVNTNIIIIIWIVVEQTRAARVRTHGLIEPLPRLPYGHSHRIMVINKTPLHPPAVSTEIFHLTPTRSQSVEEGEPASAQAHTRIVEYEWSIWKRLTFSTLVRPGTDMTRGFCFWLFDIENVCGTSRSPTHAIACKALNFEASTSTANTISHQIAPPHNNIITVIYTRCWQRIRTSSCMRTRIRDSNVVRIWRVDCGDVRCLMSSGLYVRGDRKTGLTLENGAGQQLKWNPTRAKSLTLPSKLDISENQSHLTFNVLDRPTFSGTQ